MNTALDTLSYTSDATDNVAYLDCRASQKFDDIEYFAETNHFYQQFDSVSYLRWDQTLRDSCTTRYRGLQGYLMDYTLQLNESGLKIYLIQMEQYGWVDQMMI